MPSRLRAPTRARDGGDVGREVVAPAGSYDLPSRSTAVRAATGKGVRARSRRSVGGGNALNQPFLGPPSPRTGRCVPHARYPGVRLAVASSADTPRAVEIGRAALKILEVRPVPNFDHTHSTTHICRTSITQRAQHTRVELQSHREHNTHVPNFNHTESKTHTCRTSTTQRAQHTHTELRSHT